MDIKLHEKQRLAFYSPATELLFGGAAGPGKSFLLRVSAIRWCELVPGIQVYIFRRTFPDLEANHLRGPTSLLALLAEMIDSGHVKYRAQKNEFEWVKTGSRIVLCHCQYETDVIKYQGAEIHVLMIDELTHFTEEMYRYLRGRVRCVGIKVPSDFVEYIPRIECASNPGNIGHEWVKRTFDLGSSSQKKYLEIYQTDHKDGGMKRQFVPAKSTDNPDLTKDDPNYFARLKGLGNEMLVKAMEQGDWDIFAGQYFDKFSKERHIKSLGYKIEGHWEKFGGFDWGHKHPYVFGLYAVDEDGLVIKYAECGSRGKTVEQISNEIKRCITDTVIYSSNFNLDEFLQMLQIYAGRDCFAERDGGPTIAMRFAEHGINLIPASIERIQGANTMRELLDCSDEKEPRFVLKENCWRAIKHIPKMLVDPNRPEDVRKVDATEEDEWGGDDAYDETRYALHTFFEQSKQPKNKQYEHLSGVSKDFWMAEKGDHPTQQHQDVYAEFRKMFGQ